MSFSKGEMFCFDDKFLHSSRPSTRQAFQRLQLGLMMPVTLIIEIIEILDTGMISDV